MSNKIKNLGDGYYEYRGYEIRRRNSVPSGYWGRWIVYYKRGKHFSTRRQAIEYIDGLIREKGEAMKEITETEIMRMDLSPWINDEVVTEANRRWTAIGQPAKSDVEWTLIANPQTKRYDSKPGLRQAVLAVWSPSQAEQH